ADVSGIAYIRAAECCSLVVIPHCGNLLFATNDQRRLLRIGGRLCFASIRSFSCPTERIGATCSETDKFTSAARFRICSPRDCRLAPGSCAIKVGELAAIDAAF